MERKLNEKEVEDLIFDGNISDLEDLIDDNYLIESTIFQSLMTVRMVSDAKMTNAKKRHTFTVENVRYTSASQKKGTVSSLSTHKSVLLFSKEKNMIFFICLS